MTRFSLFKILSLLLAVAALVCLAIPSADATAPALQTFSYEALPAGDGTPVPPPATSAASMALFDPTEGAFLTLCGITVTSGEHSVMP